MNEIYQLLIKSTSKQNHITQRKLYGLSSLYYKETPICIALENQIAIHIKSIVNEPKLSVTSKWFYNGKEMNNWYLLPNSFNKKRNRIQPFIDIAIKQVDYPNLLKTEKNKKKKKTKNKAAVSPQANIANKEKVEGKSIIQKIISKILSL